MAGIGLAPLEGMSDRLLVVDDDEAICQTFRSYFERVGFEVETAGTIRDAADRLSTGQYAALIVDICLSERGKEGLAIAAYVRQIGSGMPVVILTAYGSPDNAESAARLGVDAFLHKPVSLEWLTLLLLSRIAARRGELKEEEAFMRLAAVAS
jgi:two-component system, NtrC family, response regulator PilR